MESCAQIPQRELLRPGNIWWGPCKEALRGHCMKVKLKLQERPQDIRYARLTGSSQKKAAGTEWSQLRRQAVCNAGVRTRAALWSPDDCITSLIQQTWSHRIWCLPHQVMVLTWLDLSGLCSYSSLLGCDYLPHATVYQKYNLILIFAGSHYEGIAFNLKRLFGLLNYAETTKKTMGIFRD